MGYIGYSMSERAAAAYEDGEKPRSKWVKKDILAALAKSAPQNADAAKNLAEIVAARQKKRNKNNE